MFNNTYHVTVYNFKFSSLLKISLFNAELCQWQSYTCGIFLISDTIKFLVLDIQH